MPTKESSSPILILDGESKEGLSEISCKLMNKLNEEESKLRNQNSSSLEIGTWSNDMAEIEQEATATKNNHADFDDDFDPFEALPPNLTFLDDASLPQVNPAGDSRDWCTVNSLLFLKILTKFLLLSRYESTLILKPLLMLFRSLKILINSCRFFFFCKIPELRRVFKG